MLVACFTLDLLTHPLIDRCDESIFTRTEALLKRANLPTELSSDLGQLDPDHLLSLMAVDKKAAAGKLRMILLKGELNLCSTMRVVISLLVS